jgi:hypothetical protein
MYLKSSRQQWWDRRFRLSFCICKSSFTTLSSRKAFRLANVVNQCVQFQPAQVDVDVRHCVFVRFYSASQYTDATLALHAAKVSNFLWLRHSEN